jgi:hypothetical protein
MKGRMREWRHFERAQTSVRILSTSFARVSASLMVPPRAEHRKLLLDALQLLQCLVRVSHEIAAVWISVAS